MINVELTAGGGGKGETRLAKVRERNKALLVQRVSISPILLAHSLMI
jgi:nucleolar protein 6